MRHTYIMPLILTVLLVLAGCSFLDVPGPYSAVRIEPRPIAIAPAPAVAPASPSYMEATAVSGHQEARADSAVDAALGWAEKHAELSEKFIKAQEDNRQLEAQNRQMTAQVSELGTDLKQTQEELTSANDMLVEFRTELRGWKKDVLGNRQKLDGQHKVEMEALLKILVFLGGEIPESSTASTAPATSVVPVSPALKELSSESQK